jgi:maltose-binding protein MalE
MSDEDATGLLIEGTASMTSIPPASYADILGQAPEMIANGQFYFSTNWKGPSGARGIVGGDGIMFPKPPEGANEDEWNMKQEAAADMMDNYLYFSDFFQERMFSTLGGGPVREDMTAEDIMNAVSDPSGYEQSNVINATLSGSFDNDNIMIEPQAPMYGAIQYNIMPPQIQQAMQGSKSVEQALNDAAEESRNRFF